MSKLLTDNVLYGGEKLQCVVTSISAENDNICQYHVGDKLYMAADITVVMQPGPNGYMPWAKVTLNNGKIVFVNLCQSVEFMFAETSDVAEGVNEVRT